jgi:hypothetical protein
VILKLLFDVAFYEMKNEIVHVVDKAYPTKLNGELKILANHFAITRRYVRINHFNRGLLIKEHNSCPLEFQLIDHYMNIVT